MAYYNKGSSLYALGRKEEAIIAYDQAIKINPDYAMAYYNKGSSLYALGRKEEAIIAYDQAIKINPDNPLYLCNRGALLSKLGKDKEAQNDHKESFDLMSKKQYGDNISEGNIAFIEDTLKSFNIVNGNLDKVVDDYIKKNPEDEAKILEAQKQIKDSILNAVGKNISEAISKGGDTKAKALTSLELMQAQINDLEKQAETNPTIAALLLLLKNHDSQINDNKADLNYVNENLDRIGGDVNDLTHKVNVVKINCLTESLYDNLILNHPEILSFVTKHCNGNMSRAIDLGANLTKGDMEILQLLLGNEGQGGFVEQI